MGFIAFEFSCPEHGLFDELVQRSDDVTIQPCPKCAQESPRVLSAVMGKMAMAGFSRGKNDTKMPAGVMDTEPLADGMPIEDWKAGRQKQVEAEQYTQIKKMLE